MTTFEVPSIPKRTVQSCLSVPRLRDRRISMLAMVGSARTKHTVADKMGIEISLLLISAHATSTRQSGVKAARRPRGGQDAYAGRSRMAAAWQSHWSRPCRLGMPEVHLALKTGSIDGQENPLSILNAAKFCEVTEQVVLTAHLVQPVFFNIASRSGTSSRLSSRTLSRQRRAMRQSSTIPAGSPMKRPSSTLKGRGRVDVIDPRPSGPWPIRSMRSRTRRRPGTPD